MNYDAGSRKPSVTELITPSEAIQADVVADLQAQLLREASKHKGILLMGTWPSGVTNEVYATVAKAKADGAIVLMDAFKPSDEVAAILAQGAVDIYKVNAFEICTIMGAEGLKEGEVTAEQVKDAVSRAFERFPGVQNFAITDGPSGAFLFSREPRSAVRYEIPKVSCLNPIGAGDTVAGVTMAAICSGLAATLQDAMHLGLAAASAKVQNESEGGVFEMATMRAMKDLITCSPIEW
jgi:fructose-1-phosphate kinase PfkB-like protein